MKTFSSVNYSIYCIYLRFNKVSIPVIMHINSQEKEIILFTVDTYSDKTKSAAHYISILLQQSLGHLFHCLGNSLSELPSTTEELTPMAVFIAGTDLPINIIPTQEECQRGCSFLFLQCHNFVASTSFAIFWEWLSTYGLVQSPRTIVNHSHK